MSSEKSESEQVKDVIEKLKVNNEQLKTGLHSLISRTHYTKAFTQTLGDLIEQDPVEAIIKIANLNPNTVSPRSINHSNGIGKELAAHASDKKLLLETASSLMPIGTSSHCLRESLDIFPLDTILSNSHHELIIENNLVIGFNNIISEKKFQPALIPIETPTKSTSDNQQILPQKTLFEFPFPAPKPHESLQDWVISQLKYSLKNIKIEDRDWPTKPHDIEKILKNGPTKVALVQIMEICHFIFNDCGQMSVTATDHDYQKICTTSIEEFRALNWLSIASSIVAQNQETKNNSPDNAILTELPIGKLSVITGDEKYPELTLSGGEIDVITLRIPNAKSKFSQLPLRQINQFLENEFHNQSKRYREKNDQGETSKSRLGRTLKSCFHLLYRYFGDEIIDNLEIIIKDYKFIAGDGGWHVAFDKNNLPIQKHESQIRDYLILTLGQLYSIDKKYHETRHLNNIFDVDTKTAPVSLNELLDFAAKKNLLSRLKGQLCYQIPGQEYLHEIGSDDLAVWQEWGQTLISERVKQFPEYQQHLYLRLLKNALYPKEELNKLHRENNHLPESINWGKYLYQNYILIQELSADLLENKVTFERGVIYQDGTTVLWLEFENSIIRLAVNKQGNFTAIGFEGIIGTINGCLSSDIEMVGVKQNSDTLLNLFYENIIDKLDPQKFVIENQLDLSRQTIGPDGEILDLVPGKPIVALVNHLTGMWQLDRKLLQEVTEDGSIHTTHLLKLATALSQESIREQSIMCPLPTHPNHNSEAAFLYTDHIKCFGCGYNIKIADISGRHIKHLPMEPSDSPVSYREVTIDRQNSIKSFFALGSKLNLHPDAVNYLIKYRGLNPNDIGQNNYAYYPPDLAHFISQIADYEFGKMSALTVLEKKLNKIDPKLKYESLFDYAKGKHDFVLSLRRLVDTFPEIRETIKNEIDTITLDNLQTLLKKHKTAIQTSQNDIRQQCLGYYVSRSPELQEKFNELVHKYPEIQEDLHQLRFTQMEQWHQRGLIGKDKSGADYMGGRIFFETNWISGTSLQPGNVIARGITSPEGTNLYEGPKHLKAFMGPKKRKNGHSLYTHPTPPGIWLPSPENFINSVAASKKLLLLEGPITTASFVKIFPEYRNISAAVVGFPGIQLVALLKWFGITGYHPKNSHPSINLDINEIILGTDFDKGGTNGFFQLHKHIKETFPEVTITPIQDIISNDLPVKKFLRPYDPNLYKEDGLLVNEPKIDWNDILLVLEGKKSSWLH